MSRMDAYDDYDDDYSNAQYLWPSIKERAIKGKPGQTLLKELEVALLALPEPKLIEGEFCKDGGVCALGALALQREIAGGKSREDALAAVEKRYEYWDECDPAGFAHDKLKLTHSLAFEIIYRNELRGTPEERYKYVLEWVRKRLVT